MDRPLRPGEPRPCVRAGGFTYVWVLMVLAVMSVGLLAVSELWSNMSRRQKVAEANWIGLQYVQAIRSYYYSTPGEPKQFPKRADELLEDRRLGFVRRHLRDIYPDPFSSGPGWDFKRDVNGGIIGVEGGAGSGKDAVRFNFAFDPASETPTSR